MTLLAVRGITKAFGGREILRGVDLELPDGARIGLVGPNGSGKSTLLRIVWATRRPMQGRSPASVACGWRCSPSTRWATNGRRTDVAGRAGRPA